MKAIYTALLGAQLSIAFLFTPAFSNSIESHQWGLCGGGSLNQDRRYDLGDVTATGGGGYNFYTIDSDYWYGQRESYHLCLGGYQRFIANSGSLDDFTYWQEKGLQTTASFFPWQYVLLPGDTHTPLYILGDFYSGLGPWLSLNSPMKLEKNTNQALVPTYTGGVNDTSVKPSLATRISGGLALLLGKTIRMNNVSIDTTVEVRYGLTETGRTTQILANLLLGEY